MTGMHVASETATPLSTRNQLRALALGPARPLPRAAPSVQPRVRDRVGMRTARPCRLQPVRSAAATVEKKQGVAVKPDVSETILLQGFGWESWKKDGGWYNHLRGQVNDIAAAGFTHIWLPPPSQSVSREGYLPCEMYDLNTPYGSRDDLKALCAALNEAGVTPMADLVLNHRSAGEQSPDGTWNQFTDKIDHPGARMDWGPWAIPCGDPEFNGTGNTDTGEDFGPAPDVDHRNEVVRQGYKDWMTWLASEIGFRGWRLDYVKGFSADFVKEYVHATLGPDVFHVSEYWTDLHWEGAELGRCQNNARQCLCDYLDACGASSFMFDFPTKGVLNAAAGNCQYDRLADSDGKAPGLLGWWPERAVTFVDNHDTGSSQQHWPFPSAVADQGYAYILTHPGVPSVLWEDYKRPDVYDRVNDLIALRRRAGIKSGSKLEILAAKRDMYVAKIDDRVLLKMGPCMDMGKLCPDESWKCVISGNDWAVWEKQGVVSTEKKQGA